MTISPQEQFNDFCQIVATGKSDKVKEWIKNNPDIPIDSHADRGPFNGLTPLYIAVSKSDYKTAQLLIESKAVIDLDCKNGDSVIECAMILNNNAILKLLGSDCSSDDETEVRIDVE